MLWYLWSSACPGKDIPASSSTDTHTAVHLTAWSIKLFRSKVQHLQFAPKVFFKRGNLVCMLRMASYDLKEHPETHTHVPSSDPSIFRIFCWLAADPVDQVSWQPAGTQLFLCSTCSTSSIYYKYTNSLWFPQTFAFSPTSSDRLDVFMICSMLQQLNPVNLCMVKKPQSGQNCKHHVCSGHLVTSVIQSASGQMHL